MSRLFEPCAIGSMSLKNRFVRSATGESMADRDGVLKEGVFGMYEALSAGGAGLIISGHMYVHERWKCSPRQTGAWDDRHIEGLARMALAAQANGAKSAAQVNYAARPPAEMTPDEIEEALGCFVDAARRAVTAGFDAVQIHAAHGYLVSGFLTPSENTRDDEYGGDAAGRRRLLMEIVAGVRETVGAGCPMLCKLGVVDGRDDSLPLEESVQTAAALAETGIDAIEVSSTFGGDYANPAAPGIDGPEKEAYFADAARAVKQAVDVPVILVGGLRSRAVMDRVLDDGTCDLVSLCRPFIYEPDLVNRLAEGKTDVAACISCNKCFNPRGTRCAVREARETA